MVAGHHGQAVFCRAQGPFEVPPHAHGAQWGVSVAGALQLTVDGRTNTYGPGGTSDIPAGAEHAARLEADTSVIDVFQDPDRYRAK